MNNPAQRDITAVSPVFEERISASLAAPFMPGTAIRRNPASCSGCFNVINPRIGPLSRRLGSAASFTGRVTGTSVLAGIPSLLAPSTLPTKVLSGPFADCLTGMSAPSWILLCCGESADIPVPGGAGPGVCPEGTSFFSGGGAASADVFGMTTRTHLPFTARVPLSSGAPSGIPAAKAEPVFPQNTTMPIIRPARSIRTAVIFRFPAVFPHFASLIPYHTPPFQLAPKGREPRGSPRFKGTLQAYPPCVI